MSPNPNEIHVIPKDAKIPVEIGTGFLMRLQKILFFFVNGKTSEELDQLKELAEGGSIPEDSWMYHFQTIQELVLTLEQIAIDKKIATAKTADDVALDDQ